MMRRLGGIALLILALTVFTACSPPYEDEAFDKAVDGIDHVTGTSGGCQNIDLSYQCDTTVEMSLEATTDDIEKVIKATGKLLRDNGNDSSTTTVNNNLDGPPHGATLEFSKPLKDGADIAAAMQASATDDTVKLARFSQNPRGLEISLTSKEDQLAPLARAGEQLLTTTGANSIQAVTEHSTFRIDASKGAWPEAEVTVLAAVSKRYRVEKAHAREDFLSIASSAEDMKEASTFAKRQNGYDTIGFVDITNDVLSDLANAPEADLEAVAALTYELRLQPGYNSVFADEGGLTIRVQSVDTVTAMDRTLSRKFATEYAGLGITYAIEKWFHLQRTAGQDLWLDTARSLDKSGVLNRIWVGKNEPNGTERVIDVSGKSGVEIRELAKVVAEAWQPDQTARIRITAFSADSRTSTRFDGAEAITIDENSGTPENQVRSIIEGWAEGRAAG